MDRAKARAIIDAVLARHNEMLTPVTARGAYAEVDGVMFKCVRVHTEHLISVADDGKWPLATLAERLTADLARYMTGVHAGLVDMTGHGEYFVRDDGDLSECMDAWCFALAGVRLMRRE